MSIIHKKIVYGFIALTLTLTACSAAAWAGGSLPRRGGNARTNPSGAPEPQMIHLMFMAGAGMIVFTNRQKRLRKK